VHRQEVELLAIGAGPANLALAVALEELAPELSSETLIIEQQDDVCWQPGMLLPWTLSQVSFLKDLVTPRNPRSKFTFLNYMHSTDRFFDFVNLGTLLPYRSEISDYLRWVAHQLTDVRVEFGQRCVSVEPDAPGDAGEVGRWLVRTADGREIACRNLVIGAGRDPFVPAPLRALPREHIIHSTEFAGRMEELDPTVPYRIAVVGGAQSAAEMLWAVHQRCPKADCTMLMRSTGLNYYQTSKFTNELYYPSFIDNFFGARPEARDQMLRELHLHSFSGVTTAMHDTLYREMYLERLAGAERLHMIVMADVFEARVDDCEVVLSYTDRLTGQGAELACDIVLLGTGYDGEMPALVRQVANSVGVERATVDRRYRLNLPESVTAPCYALGVNDATHGPADSHLSVLATRSAELVGDLLARRQSAELDTELGTGVELVTKEGLPRW
jgi:L-ornithine N5-oxygenase